MRDEIRERIEAVRRGEVPEGYVVENHQLRPVEWGYDRIGEHLIAYDEYSNDTERYPLATSSRQGLMLQSDYYGDQRYDETTGGFHVVPEGYITYRHMSDDDIFKFNINTMGTPVLVSPEYPVFTTDAALNKAILLEYLNEMKEFRAFCSAQKKGSTRTRMYFSRLGEFSMPIPPVGEQHRIAKILSCCDEAIELKKKLLKERITQKQCLMQCIFGANYPLHLTGLSKEHWRRTLIRDIADVYSGGTPATDVTQYWNGDISWCTPSDITAAGKYIDHTATTISKLGLQNSSAVLMPVSSILMCSRATIGPRSINKVPMATNQGFKNFVCKEGITSEYLYYAIETVLPDLLKSAAGNTFKEVSKKDVEHTTILLPPIQDQKTTVDVLSSMDVVIEACKNELVYWEQKKKSLTHLLLTGIVRVNA